MEPLIKIDLHKILRSRIKGWKGRLIPSFLITALERLIRQDELNAILEYAYPREGTEFSDAVLKHLNITVETEGTDRIPEGRLLFASNHPLGGLDGITMIKVLGDMYGDDRVRFLVNDMLMNVAPLRKVFLPINKYGNQAREAAKAINETYESDKQMLIFPAGLVSRLHDDGTVSDLEWQKAFVAKAIASGRTIVPVRFVALNRPKFYRLARCRKRSGLKINIEQSMLPAELCESQGKKFRIIFGDPITPAELKSSGKTPSELAAIVRRKIYALSPPEHL